MGDNTIMSNRAVVYKTAPQMEHKAAQELREAGARAYVGRDRGSRRSPFTGKLKTPAPGYVFSDRSCSIAFAKHVGQKLGVVRKDELARLYIAKPQRRAETEANPYKPGQAAFKGEIPVTVASTSGRFCRIEWDMLGKRQTQSIHYTQLRPG
jgi:hypothetical protein